jgi:hypothetical protein
VEWSLRYYVGHFRVDHYDGAIKRDLQTHQERPAKTFLVHVRTQHAPLLPISWIARPHLNQSICVQAAGSLGHRVKSIAAICIRREHCIWYRGDGPRLWVHEGRTRPQYVCTLSLFNLVPEGCSSLSPTFSVPQQKQWPAGQPAWPPLRSSRSLSINTKRRLQPWENKKTRTSVLSSTDVGCVCAKVSKVLALVGEIDFAICNRREAGPKQSSCERSSMRSWSRRILRIDLSERRFFVGS